MGFFIAALPLFLIIFIDGMGLGLVIPLLNSLVVDPSTGFLAESITDSTRSFLYGLIIGIFMLCWFFGAAVLGDLSDSIGRKKALMICILGACGGYVLSSLAVMFKSVALLMAGRVVAGFTSGSQPIAQAAVVDLSTLKTKARNIGLVLMALFVGFVVGPMLGGVLSDSKIVSWFSFSTPFTFVAILSLVNALLLQLFFKETFIKKKPVSIRCFHAVQIFISAFKSQQIRYLSLIFLIYVMGWSNYYSFATYFVFKRYGFDPLQATFFMAYLGLGFVIGSGFLTRLMSRWLSLKTIVVVSLILTALFILMMIVTHEPIYAWITVAPTAAFSISAYSTILTIFSNQVDQNSQGWVMGITGSIVAFSFGVIGLLGGVLLHQSENVPFILGIGCLLFSALLLLFYKPGHDGQAH